MELTVSVAEGVDGELAEVVAALAGELRCQRSWLVRQEPGSAQQPTYA